MRDEDLQAVNDLRKRNGAVMLPVLHGLGGLHQDDEVVVLALVVHLDLLIVAAHVDEVVESIGM